MQDNIKKIRKSLKSKLDEARYEHTLGVAYTAMALAMRYDVTLEKAEVAGLLHDCAKYLSDKKKLEKCERYNITVTESERKNLSLLHAKLGAFFAMNKYGVSDREIVNAILNHTTGKPKMSMLDKIIYVADYIEPRRDRANNLAEVRKIAFEDIDESVYIIMRDTIAYLQKKEIYIDKITERAFNYYKLLHNNKFAVLSKECEGNEGTVENIKNSKEELKICKNESDDVVEDIK